MRNNMKIPTPLDNTIIGKLWPKVESIKIRVEEQNNYLYNTKESSDGRTYSPTDLCNFKFHCINPNCTCGFFDLFDEVSNMVYCKEIKCKGVKKCSGNEKICCNRRCLSKLAFEIEIEYTDAG